MARNNGEHMEQVTLFAWVRLNLESALNPMIKNAFGLCYAVPNGFYSKSYKVVSDMKAEGLTKGILDVNLDWPAPAGKNKNSYSYACFHGLRIEMKYGKNGLDTEQKKKKALFEKAGYKTAVCYTAADAIKEIVKYLPYEEDQYQGIKEFMR